MSVWGDDEGEARCVKSAVSHCWLLTEFVVEDTTVVWRVTGLGSEGGKSFSIEYALLERDCDEESGVAISQQFLQMFPIWIDYFLLFVCFFFPFFFSVENENREAHSCFI